MFPPATCAARSKKEGSWHTGAALTHSSKAAKLVYRSELMKLVHPYKICHLTTRCLVYISYCVKYVIQPSFCFPVTYKNSTTNYCRHKGFFWVCIPSWIKAVSMKCFSFASLYCTNKGPYIYVNTVVELTSYSSEICPSVMDVIFALGKGICFLRFSCSYFYTGTE